MRILGKFIDLTTQDQRPGPRDDTIATGTRWPGSLQRLVRCHLSLALFFVFSGFLARFFGNDCSRAVNVISSLIQARSSICPSIRKYGFAPGYGGASIGRRM